MSRLTFIASMTIALALWTRAARAQESPFESPGVKDKLPAFYEKLSSRMDYPLSWLHGGHGDFAAWRQKTRARVMQCLLTPPPVVPFAPKIIAEQDRGSYVARKVVFNVTGDSRVLAFLLVPKSAGPHPAVLLLHDHGAKFDIGKEKVIEPWEESPEKVESARKWVAQYYGGHFIGDERNTRKILIGARQPRCETGTDRIIADAADNGDLACRTKKRHDDIATNRK